MFLFLDISKGLLIGREEEKERGLTPKNVDNVVNLIVDILSMDSLKSGVTSKYEIMVTARELSVSDRHLAMMLDAGILKAFPLVGASGFGEWMIMMYPEPIDGKHMDILPPLASA